MTGSFVPLKCRFTFPSEKTPMGKSEHFYFYVPTIQNVDVGQKKNKL